MNIIFDARYIKSKHDGISRFSLGLLTSLSAKTKLTAIVASKDQAKLLPKNISTVQLNPVDSWREIFIARKINKLKPDVVYSPMQLMGSFGRKYKLVLTLHDTIYYKFHTTPNNIAPHLKFIWFLFHLAYWPQRLLLNRADIVATVSETSKQEIQALKLTKRPIWVIPNGIDSIHRSRGVHDKNLIYMGSTFKYKNVDFLIKAINELPEFSLHILSRVSDPEKGRLRQLVTNKKQLVFHDGVTESQYKEALSSSFALVTASKAEGFGLPIIEAFAYGLPVVCSDLAVFKEISHGAALFFDPDSSSEFCKKIGILNDQKIRMDHIAAGYKSAEKYTWEKSADTLLSLISGLKKI
jgi:glycosyltransferase involved in cell wall biosynthesis